MFAHILFPTDGSPLSRKAAEVAADVARANHARITTLHVIPNFTTPMITEGSYVTPEMFNEEAYKEHTEAAANRLFAEVDQVAQKAKVSVEHVSVNSDHPWEAIIKAARKNKCDLIVMASHGRRGLEGLLLGSETNKVLTHSKIPVLVCR
jgi:nucleotide-binding universal stress UspA family protein